MGDVEGRGETCRIENSLRIKHPRPEPFRVSVYVFVGYAGEAEFCSGDAVAAGVEVELCRDNSVSISVWTRERGNGLMISPTLAVVCFGVKACPSRPTAIVLVAGGVEVEDRSEAVGVGVGTTDDVLK